MLVRRSHHLPERSEGPAHLEGCRARMSTRSVSLRVRMRDRRDHAGCSAASSGRLSSQWRASCCSAKTANRAKALRLLGEQPGLACQDGITGDERERAGTTVQLALADDLGERWIRSSGRSEVTPVTSNSVRMPSPSPVRDRTGSRRGRSPSACPSRSPAPGAFRGRRSIKSAWGMRHRLRPPSTMHSVERPGKELGFVIRRSAPPRARDHRDRQRERLGARRRRIADTPGWVEDRGALLLHERMGAVDIGAVGGVRNAR